jgi:hypothetical protein
MADVSSDYDKATDRILSKIPKNDPELAQCIDYGKSTFLGASNACVCSLMGKSEAAITMRDGLHKEYMESGSDSLSGHLKYIYQTRKMEGGGPPLVKLILENGLICPSIASDALNSSYGLLP